MGKLARWGLWCVLVTVLVTVAADRSGADDKLPLARVMPRGAIAYVQARNLGVLLDRWNASPTREKYFASDSYRVFQGSRLFIKLQERIAEFEQGMGFELTTDRVRNLAGGESAVAMYDMGKLELVYCTDMATAKTLANVLYQQAGRFEQRKRGTVGYYVQELSTDGGRRRQGLCFGAANGKFLVATTEPLMQRALDNLSTPTADDRLSDAIAATVPDAFAPRDLTLWTDVPRLQAQRYFKQYWIQGQPLDGIAATLADLEFAPDGIRERRWSLLADEAPAAGKPAEASAVTDLLRFSPPDAQAFAVRTTDETLARSLTTLLFPPPATPRPVRGDLPPTPEPMVDGDTLTARYQTLDERFDQDIDAPGTPPVTFPGATANAAPDPDAPFVKALDDMLSGARVVRSAWFGATRAEDGTPFARIDRGFAIECEKTFDAKRFEDLVTQKLRERLLVKGTSAALDWTTTPDGVRVPPAGLVAQGGAYRIVDNKFVVIANSPTVCSAMIAAYRLKAAPRFTPELKGVERFAVIRLDRAALPYRALTRQLEYQPRDAAQPLSEEDGGNETDAPVPCLSGNLGSLLETVAYVGDVSVETARDGKRITERLEYRFNTPPQPVKPKG